MVLQLCSQGEKCLWNYHNELLQGGRGIVPFKRSFSSWPLCSASTWVPPEGADTLALGLCAEVLQSQTAVAGQRWDSVPALGAAAGAALPHLTSKNPAPPPPLPAAKIPVKQPQRRLLGGNSVLQGTSSNPSILWPKNKAFLCFWIIRTGRSTECQSFSEMLPFYPGIKYPLQFSTA